MGFFVERDGNSDPLSSKESIGVRELLHALNGRAGLPDMTDNGPTVGVAGAAFAGGVSDSGLSELPAFQWFGLGRIG